MVRLSSRDTSLLMDLLEQTDLPDNERLNILNDATPQVREIGNALLNPTQAIDNADIREAVEQIRLWVDETRKIEEKQRLYA